MTTQFKTLKLIKFETCPSDVGHVKPPGAVTVVIEMGVVVVGVRVVLTVDVGSKN